MLAADSESDSDSASLTSEDLEDMLIVADLDTIDLDQCRDVLECIMEPDPEEESVEFFDVYYRVFSAVSKIMELNWHTVTSKTKDRILIESRSNIHEAPFGFLGQEFFGFLLGFSHNQQALSSTLSMNFGLEFTIPDMSIWTVAMTRGHVGLLWKIKKEIADNAEVLMAIMMLRQETSARSPSSFHSLQGDPARSHDKHIVIAGHTWCHLASVRFHVWVRGDEPINVDNDNNELLARGTLFPNQDMDEVEAMIKKGMKMTQDLSCYFLPRGSSGTWQLRIPPMPGTTHGTICPPEAPPLSTTFCKITATRDPTRYSFQPHSHE
ncbi:hypothetical protein DFJ58DRAFT_861492 [Suillus subalutaceus]|uniref:uncharacterized protein n=1 Tax=Suillus subalutaceus TaxID=48586 RepID=UPI001B873E78|nr:uncharacterized protein DFJ58DRAFT_861492 [Suillus subalutaceus]KAG1867237.1 hypothetical protein DFJ58DRAFT_861492 [Suillus subalutaceus]